MARGLCGTTIIRPLAARNSNTDGRNGRNRPSVTESARDARGRSGGTFEILRCVASAIVWFREHRASGGLRVRIILPLDSETDPSLRSAASAFGKG